MLKHQAKYAFRSFPKVGGEDDLRLGARSATRNVSAHWNKKPQSGLRVKLKQSSPAQIQSDAHASITQSNPRCQRVPTRSALSSLLLAKRACAASDVPSSSFIVLDAKKRASPLLVQPRSVYPPSHLCSRKPHSPLPRCPLPMPSMPPVHCPRKPGNTLKEELDIPFQPILELDKG